MSELWQFVAGRPLISLAVILLALLLLGWLLYRLIRRGETRGAIEPSDLGLCGEAPAEIIAFTSDPLRGEVRRSFARAESSLRRKLPGWRRRYAHPWVLAMGPADGGKTTLLSRSGMALPYGGPVPDSPGISWWAFEGGIVLDVAGRSCLQSEACTSDDEEWRGLLRKIRKSRRRRPVDAVLLALPITELLPSGSQGDQRLARAASRAGHLHRKLVEAQRQLRMRLPIYLVVSHCDRLPGFASLRDSLAAGERQQIVGWSNPAPARSSDQRGVRRRVVLAQREVERHGIAADRRAKLVRVVDLEDIPGVDVLHGPANGGQVLLGRDTGRRGTADLVRPRVDGAGEASAQGPDRVWRPLPPKKPPALVRVVVHGNRRVVRQRDVGQAGPVGVAFGHPLESHPEPVAQATDPAGAERERRVALEPSGGERGAQQRGEMVFTDPRAARQPDLPVAGSPCQARERGCGEHREPPRRTRVEDCDPVESGKAGKQGRIGGR